MGDFFLPTPEEAGYFKDTQLEDILNKIRTTVNFKTFSFAPNKDWDFTIIEPQVNDVINPFGWKIVETETKEGLIWKLVPSAEKNNKLK